jgi:hypothetical protein
MEVLSSEKNMCGTRSELFSIGFAQLFLHNDCAAALARAQSFVALVLVGIF